MSVRGAAGWPLRTRDFAWAAAISAVLHTVLLAVIEPPDPAAMRPTDWPRIDVTFARLAPTRAHKPSAHVTPAPVLHPDVLQLPTATPGTVRGRATQKAVRKSPRAKRPPRVVRAAQNKPPRKPPGDTIGATAADPVVDPPSPDGEGPALESADAQAAGASEGAPAWRDLASVFPEKLELEYSIREAGDETVLGWMVHRFERDGDRYRIRSQIDAIGVASFFVKGRYVQRSEGRLTVAGLRPERFMVRRGRRERVERATFDWATSRATLSGEQGSHEWTLKVGAQDQLSLVHQIAFLMEQQAPSRIMVTNGRRFEIARIEVLGREMVHSELGPMDTLRIRGDFERGVRMQIWLAPDVGYLPVRLRLRDKRGREAEQVLANVKVKW